MSAARGQHLVGLEALRFLCAVAILFWHYSHFGYVGSQQLLIDSTQAQPLYRQLSWLYSYGALAVQVFWCISGFVFAWKYGESIHNGRTSAREFFWLRFSRLYPLHIVTLLLVAALQWHYYALHHQYFVYPSNGAAEFGLHLLFASNWFHSASADDYSFNGPVWSVSIEVLIYGLFFLIARRCGATLVLSCALTIAAGALFVSGLVKSAVVLCIHYYFLGVLTAHVYARVNAASAPSRGLYRIVLFASIVALLLAAHHFDVKPTRALSALVPLLMLAAIELFVQIDGLPNRLVSAAGELTYSIYMTHFPLQLAIVVAMAHWGVAPPWQHIGFLAAFVCTSIVLGALSFHFLERPTRRYLRAQYRS